MTAFMQHSSAKPGLDMVSCQHFLSGIGQYGYHLSRHMQAAYQVKLFKPYRADHPDSHLHQLDWVEKIKYRSFRNLHPYLLPLFIAKTMMQHRQKGAVVHAHWFLSGLAASCLKNKFVVTMHDVSLLHIQEKGGTYTAYYRWAIERFKKMGIPLIVVSETAKQDAIRYVKYPESLVHAIPNGLDFHRFYPNTSTVKSTEAQEYFRIIYAGGLGARKNIGLLLNVFAKLEQQYSHVELVIAGAYPEKTSYPAMAQELGIKRISFIGYVPDEQMGDFYRSGDLFIYPSLYEGFGFAPLEAMACGIPVLCSKGGALSEIASGGSTQFDYDERELYEMASFYIESETERHTLTTQGSTWVQQFKWQTTAKKTLEVYGTL